MTLNLDSEANINKKTTDRKEKHASNFDQKENISSWWKTSQQLCPNNLLHRANLIQDVTQAKDEPFRSHEMMNNTITITAHPPMA